MAAKDTGAGPGLEQRVARLEAALLALLERDHYTAGLAELTGRFERESPSLRLAFLERALGVAPTTASQSTTQESPTVKYERLSAAERLQPLRDKIRALELDHYNATLDVAASGENGNAGQQQRADALEETIKKLRELEKSLESEAK